MTPGRWLAALAVLALCAPERARGAPADADLLASIDRKASARRASAVSWLLRDSDALALLADPAPEVVHAVAPAVAELGPELVVAVVEELGGQDDTRELGAALEPVLAQACRAAARLAPPAPTTAAILRSVPRERRFDVARVLVDVARARWQVAEGLAAERPLRRALRTEGTTLRLDAARRLAPLGDLGLDALVAELESEYAPEIRDAVLDAFLRAASELGPAGRAGWWDPRAAVAALPDERARAQVTALLPFGRTCAPGAAPAAADDGGARSVVPTSDHDATPTKSQPPTTGSAVRRAALDAVLAQPEVLATLFAGSEAARDTLVRALVRAAPEAGDALDALLANASAYARDTVRAAYAAQRAAVASRPDREARVDALAHVPPAERLLVARALGAVARAEQEIAERLVADEGVVAALAGGPPSPAGEQAAGALAALGDAALEPLVDELARRRWRAERDAAFERYVLAAAGDAP